MVVDPSAHVRRLPGVEVQEIGSGAVIVNMTTGKCWQLNGISLEIWNLFSQGLSVGVVTQHLEQSYPDARDRVVGDIASLVRILVSEQLVSLT
jgi:Coenzyme PQQ synthesis protein D (PqqD)